MLNYLLQVQVYFIGIDCGLAVTEGVTVTVIILAFMLNAKPLGLSTLVTKEFFILCFLTSGKPHRLPHRI